VSNKGAMQTH